MYRLILLSSAVLSVTFAFLAVPAFASTTAVLTPTSDGNYLQWLTSSGSTHYTLVDETFCNGTTDYTLTTTTTKKDSYGTSLSSIDNGASISKIAIVPCASRNSTGTGSSTLNLLYRYNGTDSSTTGSYALAANTTPAQLATSTYSSLNLFKTSTSTLEIGAVYSSGNKGIRLSREATVLTYTLTVPTAPSSLVATNSSSSANSLAWTDNSTNELGFKIYRSLNGGSYSQVATTVTWNVTSYSDTGLTADQTYSYEAVAYNDAGTTTSNISSAITYGAAPAAPTNLTAVTSTTNVVLTWADNSANEDGFKIERSTDDVTYAQIATTTPNSSSTGTYTDSGAAGTAYYYRIRAYNPKGNSAYASAVEGVYRVNVTGVYSDATWTPASIYYLNSVLSVTGAKLTINPGTIVKFDANAALSVTGAGVLSVPGTGGGRTYFTSYKDDSYGGDTNGDTTSTAPAAGNWDDIQINSGASSTIRYATVLYAGPVSGVHGNIHNNGGILTLDNVESASGSAAGVWQAAGTSNVLNSDFHHQANGVEFGGGTMTVSGCTLHDAAAFFGDGILAQGTGSLTATNNQLYNNYSSGEINVLSGLAFTPSGNTSTGTTERHGWYLLNGSTTNDATLAGSDLPYVIDANITVTSSKALTVGAGVIVKFASADALIIGSSGILKVQGTLGDEAYFTSLNDDSLIGDTNNNGATSGSAGNWDAIQLAPGASSTIAHAVVRYGGVSGSHGNIQNDGGTLTLDTVESATSGYASLWQTAGTSNVLNSDLHGQAGNYGVEVDGGTANFSANTNIHGNLDGVYSSRGTVNITSSIIHDNSSADIDNEGGILTVSSTEVATSTNYGIYQGSGTSTIISSNIHNNTYGYYNAGGAATILSNYIYNNSTFGVDNALTSTTVDAVGNYWGDYTGPTCSCNPGGVGNSISAYVEFDPWHHVNPGVWAVNQREIRYDASGTSHTTEWNAAVSTWNSRGLVNIVVATTTTDLTVSDVFRTDVTWDGHYDYFPTATDTISINGFYVERVS